MTTVLELWGMRKVAPLRDKNYRETPGMSAPDLLMGMELEIENWEFSGAEAPVGWSFTTDGSLRGESVEAITKPTKQKFLPELLKDFYSKYKITQDNYSDRCSVHVHVNCQDLTIEQVQMVALTYQVMENMLLAFVGHDRAINVFCVPWSQCTMSHAMVSNMASDGTDHVVRNWQKYTALNLLPLREYGTVEFRHLHGTCDMDVITKWLNLIGCIINYATTTSKVDFYDVISNINTTSAYKAFIQQVFGEYHIILADIADADMHIADGVLNCKLAILDDMKDKKKPSAEKKGGSIAELMRQVEANSGFFTNQVYAPPTEELRVNYQLPIAGLRADTLIIDDILEGLDRPQPLTDEARVHYQEAPRVENAVAGFPRVRLDTLIAPPARPVDFDDEEEDI